MLPKLLKSSLVILVLSLLFFGCKTQEKNSSVEVQTPSKESVLETKEKRAAELWKQVRGRQTCNLLNGCTPAKKLVALGPDVAAQVALKITKIRQAKHWRISLLRELRFTRDIRVQAAQIQMLRDKSWPIRTYAAVGLGYSRDKRFIDKIKDGLTTEPHYAVLLGYLWALTTNDPRLGRSSIVEHLKTFQETPDIRIHLVAMDSIRSLKLVEVREQVRGWLKHPNFFVVRDAILTVLDLHDRSAIPILIDLIEHEQPMVKREALRCLRKFTGLKHAHKAPAFKAWCEKHCVKP